MISRSTLILTLCLVLLIPVAPASAETGTKRHEKGVYEQLPLTDKDYHLIETSSQMHEQFKRRGLRYDDRTLETWLQSMGDRLAPETTDFYQQYRFYLIRDPSPNAFALPDGQIYVHTGLIGRLENEAQLASLLAHEINHVAGHHGILAYRSQKRKAVAGIFIGIAGAAAGGWGDVAGNLINVGIFTSIFGYSRKLEQEADINAYDRLLAAGYDVREMPKLYQILGQDFEGLQPRMKGKWSTHPDLISRGQYMSELVEDTSEEKLATLSLGDDNFRSRVRPLALVAVQDYIRDDYPKTALELAQQLVEEDPDDPEGWVATGHSYVALGVRSEYSDDEPKTKKEKKKQLRLRSRLTREELRAQAALSPDATVNLDHNLAEAESAYLAALQRDPGAAEAHQGLGDIYLQLGRYQESGKAYVMYLKLRPEAPDRTIVMTDLRDIARKLRSETGE